MIVVTYKYNPKHANQPIITEARFELWQKALRFMKMVDSKKFPGWVLSWECDDPYDNEQLAKRHHLTPMPYIE